MGRVVHSIASREASGAEVAPYYVPFPRSYYAKATHTVLCACISLCIGKAHILPVARYSPSL